MYNETHQAAGISRIRPSIAWGQNYTGIICQSGWKCESGSYLPENEITETFDSPALGNKRPNPTGGRSIALS
jgi:hypothetical protein